jgi:hypothetical protein
VNLVDGALRWTEANAKPFRDFGDAAGLVTTVKAYGELLFVLRALLPLLPQHRERLTALAVDALGAYDCFAWEDFCSVEPAGVLAVIAAHLLATAVGHHAVPSVARLERLRRIRHFSSADASAYRRLEYRYMLGLIGLRHEGAPIVHTHGNAAYMTDHESYALTHVVFYESDMGTRTLPEERRTALARQVRRCLGAALPDDNLDLLAELVASRRFLRVPADGLDENVLERLVAAQRPDGAVPAHTHPYDLESTRSTVPGRRAFERLYHSTLVTMLAGAAARC